jgi:hypothetical protein
MQVLGVYIHGPSECCSLLEATEPGCQSSQAPPGRSRTVNLLFISEASWEVELYRTVAKPGSVPPVE